MNKQTRNTRYKLKNKRQRIHDIVYGITEALAIFVFPAICIAYSVDSNMRSERLYDRNLAIEIEEDGEAADNNQTTEIAEAYTGETATEAAPVIAEPVKKEYPRQLIDMKEKYPETSAFVSEYFDKKDMAPAGTVGEVKKGEIPLLIQWDERWGYQSYGDFLIGTDGCGPTCLSMVISGLTGDNTITPYRVAYFADKNGYYESGAGSKWTLMTEGAAHFNVTGIELPLYREAVYSALEAGMPIICSVGAGDFTTNGHFIVLVGINDDKIIVNDPNSRVNSSRLWEYERLEGQIINLWTYVAQ